MRKLVLLTFLGIAVTLPLQARTKNESYISFDDGGTIVRTGDDGREIDARVNLPVFPGDEVITNRRGRAEVRLADGNFLGIDRGTSVRLRSVLDSYDNDANDTVVELKYGKAAVDRTDNATESFRLDTNNASYFAGEAAIFSVDTDAGGRDHVQVFDGNLEVRTPSRTSRIRSGESASVDDGGVYDLVTETRNAADDFERWFLARADRYGNSDSRYLDRSLAYYDDDLAGHGTWTFISGYGWGWRPYVNAGWRPYFYGQWLNSRAGCLTWVSYEPWGWVPYHYGRWAFDPIYGWFWMPGETYAPAWVYWMYSPGYIGWAPAGWYDCYRPYYDWAYRPYRTGLDFGFGFYGGVHVRDIDLRPWTFIDANTILSTRIDRAAVATDIVKARLIRDPGALAAISGSPARFTRRDLQDPAGAISAIYRRGISAGGNGQTVAAPDLTPFFRRDPELPAAIRDRLVRTRPSDGHASARIPTTALAPTAGGSIAPIGGGALAPIGRGGVAPIGGGNIAPITPGNDGQIRRADPGTVTTKPVDSGNTGHINRGRTEPANPEQRVKPDDGAGTPRPDSWRGRAVRPSDGGGDSPSDAGTLTPPRPRDDWRGRRMHEQPAPAGGSSAPKPSSDRPPQVDRRRGSDVPRRVIDGIGGARIFRAPAPRDTPPPPRATEGRSSTPPPKSEGGNHESGGSKPSSGHVERNKQ